MPQDNWHFIQRLFEYKKQAVGAHGLHSPFVYRLYAKYIRKKRRHLSSEIEQLRKTCQRAQQAISVTDFKSGTIRTKKLGEEARSSPSTATFSAFLSQLLDYINADCVLETGTSLGFNALYLAQSSVKEVWTLEGNSSIAEIAADHFTRMKAHKIKLITGDIHETFEASLQDSGADVIFLDADHRSVATSKFMDILAPHLSRIKCIIIHDIYWSKDMTNIWQELVADTRFPMTIDIFQAGLLFPNQKLEKQHFVVKF
ncbi:MAG: class I SAM-dependent methyltransferase [Cytophagales bacterium]|nr:class I SAM-dependent methyltransferase [Cytophagales bacterium]